MNMIVVDAYQRTSCLLHVCPHVLSMSSCSRNPSLGSGVHAGCCCFPPAASREACQPTTSVLREENRRARKQRRNHRETSLPTGLQHTKMYIINIDCVVYSGSGEKKKKLLLVTELRGRAGSREKLI